MTRTSAADLVPILRRIYATHLAGCCWHVVIDDGNLEADYVASCAERARQNAETHDDGSDHAACVELADALGSGRYSRTQLRKAIAIERRSEP